MDVQDLESLSSVLKQWGNFNSGVLFLVKTICKINDSPYGEVWVPDKNNEFMIWSGFWSRNEDYFEQFSKFSSLHKFARGIGLIGRTWEKKKMLWTENVTENNDFLRSEVAPIKGLNSAISIPILHDENVLCLLCFFYSKLIPSDLENTELIFSQSKSIGKILANLKQPSPRQ
jgi:hypothetical protein